MGVVFVICAAAVPFLISFLRKSRNILLGWVRIFYPMFFFGLFFRESIQMTNIIFSGRSFDAVFVNIDQWLFGLQPSIVFWQALPESRVLTELLFLCYFFFYFLMAGGCWIAYFRKDRRHAIDGFAVVSTAWYLLYIFYIFFPVKGPKYFFPELQNIWYANFNGYFFTGVMKLVFNSVTLSGAAFPSSHAAISVLALMQTYKYSKRIGIAFSPFVILLLISTVYIYAHYAIDTIAGVLLGLIFYFTIPWVVRWLRRATDSLNVRFWKESYP